MNRKGGFENKIWSDHSHSKNYDEILHKLLRVRSIMIERHKSFHLLSDEEQYEYCTTIVIIATQTVTKQVRLLRMGGDKKEIFKFSIDEGYQSITPIEISKNKRLNN
jgi:hypothetical protein